MIASKEEFITRNGKHVMDRERGVIVFETGAKMENSRTGGDEMGAWSEPSEDLFERAQTVLRYHQIVHAEAYATFNNYVKSLVQALAAARRQETTLYLPNQDAALKEAKRLRLAWKRAEKNVASAEADVAEHIPYWRVQKDEERRRTLEVVDAFQEALAKLAF